MTDKSEVDYGPLATLIGTWTGDKGLDVAPEPDGAEDNPYFETITFSAAGEVSNAESQLLAAIHYRQIVQRKSNEKIFHDETGYWMWDAETGVIMHSLTIPRAVCVLAGGIYDGETDSDGNILLTVSASLDNELWQIIQSPFMRERARTTEFRHHITAGANRLSYSETTTVEIYGKVFEHTDRNELTRQ
jgi:hypothetical protein